MADEKIRQECYARVKDVMETGILTYYNEYRGILGDERSQRAIQRSVEGLHAIYDVLDQYQITAKNEPKPGE